MSEEGTSDLYSIYYKDNRLYHAVEDGTYLYVYYDIADSEDQRYYIYYGEYSQGEKNGTGVEIGNYNDGYYYVDGTYADGYANGQCILYFSDKSSSTGQKYSEAIEGNFTDGYEDGTMSVKRIYENGSSYDFTRTADMGTFEVISYEDGRYIYMGDGENAIYFTDEAALYDNGCPNRKRT